MSISVCIFYIHYLTYHIPIPPTSSQQNTTIPQLYKSNTLPNQDKSCISHTNTNFQNQFTLNKMTGLKNTPWKGKGHLALVIPQPITCVFARLL